MLTVAIPCRGSAPDLDRCLTSLFQTDWPGRFDVLVADDGADDSVKTVADKHAVCLVRNQAQIGEGAARDRLLDHPDGAWIFCTDADVEFTDPSWAQRLVGFLMSHPDTTVAHPLVALPDGRTWGAGGALRSYGGRILPAGHRHEQELAEMVAGTDPVEVPYAPTVGWMARTVDLRCSLDWIGGYFPTIFADTDMAYWLRSQGWEFWCVPDAIITHHAGSYTKKQTPTEERQARFQAHSEEFLWWWHEWVEHDAATKWRGQVQP